MKGHGFIAYLFQTMLREHFHISASPQAKIPCCFCKYAPAMKNS